MQKLPSFVALSAPLAAALLVVSCRDAADPYPPRFAITTGSHPGLDRFNGTLSESGTQLAKGFNPTNPHLGSTLVVTFMWVGSTNTITNVFDRLTDAARTPVGNTYHLVEYVTDGGISMATYVATNIQGFSDPNTDTNGGDILAVEADFSEPITDGGVVISTFTGVEPDFSTALGAHQSTSGSGSWQTTADAGAMAADQGSLVYGVSLSNGLFGVSEGNGWRPISQLSDGAMKSDAQYVVQTDGGSAEPQWTWFYDENPHTWLASALTLRPAPGQMLVLDGTLNESGSTLGQGFYPTNPSLGDAIIATFMWKGSTNVITSVTDRLSSGTAVGNTYNLVEYVTNGGMSLATYVATNVQNFPETQPGSHDALVVEANLSEPVTDGGALLSAYSGVQTSFAQALGEHASASDTASDVTTVDPGAITVQPGALVYAVTLSGLAGLERPSDLMNISTMSDDSLKGDGEYMVSTATTATTARPQWTWYFNSHTPWVASVLTLNAR